MSKFSHCLWAGLGSLLLLAGCASTPPANPADPHEKFNRSMDKFNDGLDRAILKPVADGYTKVIPKPVRTSLGNAFTNLTYFDTVANGLLQGKFKQGGSDALRMGVNSTLGLAGLFDVAAMMKIPKHEEDFGLTLGHWGAKQGDYLVLPLYGPTTGRDVWSLPVSVVTDPLTWVPADPWWVLLPVDAVRLVDFRASAENEVRFRNAAAIDPYVFTRDAYLHYRDFKLRGGESPASQPQAPSINYYEDEDSGAATQPATQKAR